MLRNRSNEVEASSLKGIGKVCKGGKGECVAPKGASEFAEPAVSLKRYPDTKPGAFSRLQKKAGWVEITRNANWRRGERSNSASPGACPFRWSHVTIWRCKSSSIFYRRLPDTRGFSARLGAECARWCSALRSEEHTSE